MKIKDIITEAPYLHRDELPYKPLTSISRDRIEKSYAKLAELEDGFLVFKKTVSPGIISGRFVNDEFYPSVMVTTRMNAYPSDPTQLDDMMQVAMVNVAAGLKLEGITKLTYTIAIEHLDLVSDHEQYLGAQGLWKSLAKNSKANIYVFDCTINDYLRDKDGIVKYNGKNISDNTIWGSSELHKSILLVGTVKELK